MQRNAVKRAIIIKYSVTTQNHGTPGYRQDASDPRFIGVLETNVGTFPVVKRNGRAIDVLVAAGAFFKPIGFDESGEQTGGELDWNRTCKESEQGLAAALPHLKFFNHRQEKTLFEEFARRVRVAVSAYPPNPSMEYDIH